jgi:PelA/Pel-15E family pectate lyase
VMMQNPARSLLLPLLLVISWCPRVEVAAAPQPAPPIRVLLKHKVLDTAVSLPSPAHPAVRRLSPFEVREEFYFALKRHPEAQLTPLLTIPVDRRTEMVCWAWERPDGGRSFGFSGGHFHALWARPEYRRLAAQGLLWTIGREGAAARIAMNVPQSLLAADEATKQPAADPLVKDARDALLKASTWFTKNVAVHGGYVYTYSTDLKVRRGEGIASPTQIWVQPPGTPTVGLAMLQAWEATGDQQHLDGALAAARALLHGQLMSGGWTDLIDFDPQGKRTGRYRNGRGRAKGRNYSTLDDDKTQSALRFLMQLDRSLKFRDPDIHEAVKFALNAVLEAQFPNGGFPQGWQQPVPDQPVVKASYPDYDWRTEGRIKEYWDHYTLNDGLAGTVSRTLWDAWEIYGDQRCRESVERLGDFLILAQMPQPQPAWAQQYNPQLQPMWARKFEPAAIAGIESEDAIRTLIFIAEKTNEPKYLQPIPAALAWMKRSLLPDGQLARFYELRTNRPLYMKRRGDVYSLTYDDSDLPTHYSFKTRSRLPQLEAAYQAAASGVRKSSTRSLKSLRRDATRIIAELDEEGRWVTSADGSPMVGQPRLSPGEAMISSRVFSNNVERLATYIKAAAAADQQR